jgi:type II secretory pathway pseudopilin PulG
MSRHRHGSHGPRRFSLIEALVALLIFSIAAALCAETLLAAQATRRTSALSSEASQLAVAETERARAGLPTSGTLHRCPVLPAPRQSKPYRIYEDFSASAQGGWMIAAREHWNWLR